MENRTKKEIIEAIKLFELSELEGALGVTHRTLLEYVRSGKLKAVKVGGKWKVSEANLMSFINGEPQD